MKKTARKDIEDILALTPMQEGMLFHYLKDPGKDHYFEQLSLEISGAVDVRLLEKAWNIVIETNEMLRAVFRWEKMEKPVQVILEERRLKPEFYDFTGKSAAEKKTQLEKVKINGRATRFDLRKAEVPFRVTLCKIEKDKYEMMVSNHHILYDGWSNGIILKEFFNAYNHLADGKEPPKPVKAKFKEFIREIQRRDIEREEQFWNAYLKGIDTQRELSLKRRKEKEAVSVETCCIGFEKNVKDGLADFVKKNKITLSSLFYSAWGLLLHKYNNSRDVIFGTTVSGRSASVKVKGIEEVVGLFINTLPLRVETPVHGREKIEELLYRISREVQSREAFENTPLPDIKKYSEWSSTGELFDSIVAVENYPLDSRLTQTQGKLSLDSYSLVEMTHYDLTVSIVMFADIAVEFIYNKELFEPEAIEKLSGHFGRIVREIIKNPGKEIAEIDMLSVEEKTRLLEEFNAAGAGYPRDKTLHGLFAGQAEKTPDGTAAVGHGPGPGQCVTLSYKELNERSNRLAFFLHEQGIIPGDIVAIKAGRWVELIIGLLGILKAGCAYLPINPGSPGKRTRCMMEDSGARMLIGDDQVNVQGSALKVEHRTLNNLIAYIIFTSGSTGQPKGVPITHANISPLLHWGYGELGLGTKDRVVQNLSYYFDWSVWEIFIAITTGAALYMVPEEILLDADAYIPFMNRNGITVLHITPTQFGYLINSRLKPRTLKYLFIGAEKLDRDLLERSFEAVGPDCRVFNMYGPTEATIISAVLEIDRHGLKEFKGLSSVPIGGPVGNTRLLVLDGYLKLCPVNVPGELYIGGDGIANGYLNQPGLTAEKFCLRRPGGLILKKPPPWTPRKNFLLKQKFCGGPLRIYRTGDFARWLGNGTVEFLGRIDHQVKIRGFRIEPGEIENRLLEHENVKEAVVIVRDRGEEKYLCAYVAAQGAGSIEYLREFLSSTLPDYMIPSFFMRIDEIPLNPNGKLDRKALPAPGIKTRKEYAAPRNELEKKLAAIWSDILGIEKEKTGIDDHFFEQGGHSLKAVGLTGKIHKTFNIRIPLRELFKIPTIRKIAGYINKTGKSVYRAIEPAEKKEYYVLSAARKSLFTLQQKDRGSTVYNMFEVMSLEGEIEPGKFEEPFRALIKRHESLRASFEIMAGEPVQRIHNDVEFSIEYCNLSAGDIYGPPAPRTFDLSRAPLLRVALTKTGRKKHTLMVDMHHIVSDGISAELFLHEFTVLYRGEELPPLKLQYKDYLEWRHRNKESPSTVKQRQYWEKEFAGEIPGLELPTDFVRPKIQSFEGRQVTFEITGEEVSRLKDLVREKGTTLYVVLLALFYVFLAKITNREAIVVGTPLSGRSHANLEAVMGMFVNTVGINGCPHSRKSFTGFLEEIRAKVSEAFENQDYPFEEVVERSPLFETVFALQTVNVNELAIPGLKYLPYDDESRTAKFDLMLLAKEVKASERLLFTFEYRTRLFKVETIQRFTNYFKKIVTDVSGRPSVKVEEIEILPEADRQQILYHFNGTVSEYPKDKSIHGLFEEESKKYPGRAAVVYEDRVLSYRELDRQSGNLAAYLSNKEVKPGEPVGIMLETSLKMIVSVLAVLKVGGVYLPIDPHYPAERIKFMLSDSRTRILITPKTKVLWGSRGRFFKRAPWPPEACAYIIYTSGSTGRPKGVLVEHRNVIRLVKNTNYITFRESGRLLQTGALEFDASTFEIWGSLLNGLTLYLAHRDTILDAGQLKKTISSNRITIMWMTSPLFNRMVQGDVEIFAGLENLLVGGDVLSPGHINRVKERFPRLNIINGYGPTENTTFSTTFLIEKEYSEAIPIGGPIANSSAYIVDSNGHWQPIGIAGELWVGGDGVARGYLNNPELTAERFCKRLYKTGDQARWLADGNIEFFGRIDQQVKIRGFRIEPGEIASHLLNHEHIKEAVVLAKMGESADKYLCAYIVSGRELTAPGLREFLSANLPDYMIPSYFVLLEKIPLTANGKVDWRALPEPEAAVPADRGAAPRDEIEEALAEIWAGVLGIDKKAVGIDTDFFESGGHSLKAAHLLSGIYKAFHVNLSLTDIFTTPTIRELAPHIKEAAKEKYIPIEPAEKREYYVLSSAQKRLYFLQQMVENSTSYNMTESFELEGNLDKERLAETFSALIKRHESLRTSFHMKGEEPVQKIHKENYKSQITNITGNFIRPFDLSKAPLLRVGLLELEKAKHILMVDMHHIISDGSSVEIFVREFTTLYRGKGPPLLRLHYKDYAQWDRGHKEDRRLARQREYWLGKFAGEIPVLELPADYVRPLVQSFEGNTVDFSISGERAHALRNIGKDEGATLFMTLLAVNVVFLAKLSGREDIVVGTPEAGRRHADLEPVMGMFVNTLALRNYPNGEKSFREFLKEVKENTLTAFENRDYQYEDLVEGVVSQRDASRNPLFDTAFALQDANIRRFELPGLSIKTREFDAGISKFDLTLFAVESGKQLLFRLEYCSKLFKPVSIQRFINYYQQTVSFVTGDAGIKIGQIEIIPEAEKKRVLVDFNRREEEYRGDKTLPGLFEEQVEKGADHTALVGGSLTLTYRELNRESGRLAHLLKEKGLQPGTIAAIMVERSIGMIIGILGILKTGAAYLPINTGLPGARKDYMLKDSSARVLIGDGGFNVSPLGEKRQIKAPNAVRHAPCAMRLAYIIYTSGSTGEPKGVGVRHSNVSPLLHWGYRCIGPGPGDRILQNVPYHFDWSVWEIFITLTSGAYLYILPDEIILDPVSCVDYIISREITMLHITPTRYGYLANPGRRLETLNYLLIGGEKLSPEQVKGIFQRIGEGCRVFNMYGPTEVTIISTTLEIDRTGLKEFKKLSGIPIGKPAANLAIFILDKYKRVCPVNIPGEVYISGDGVSAGYLNNPELTAEKFFICGGPVLLYPGHLFPLKEFYKTGDLCRWLPDHHGNIEFLGRIDHQVKIRGLRIEPGEIESRLSMHNEIKEAVVTAHGGVSSDEYLCAYIVSDRAFEASELRVYLSRQLPDYMVPSYFVQLAKWPLTPTGKLDRKALPPPAVENRGKYVPAESSTGKKLTKIWSEILHVDRSIIGIDANFFELGGHSLKAAALIAKVHQVFGVKIPTAEIFRLPTIRELAGFIKSGTEEKYLSIEKTEKKEYYPLSSAQKRLYLLYRMDKESTGYNMPAVMTLEGNVEEEKIEETFKRLVDRHESLRTSFHTVDGGPVQRVHEENHKLQITNYKQITGSELQIANITGSFVFVFDLAQAPLLRVGLVKVKERHYILMVDMHHIVSDGVSVGLLVKEFGVLHGGGKLPGPRLTYKDYARWQLAQQEKGFIKRQETYWLGEFAGEIPVLALPTDFPRPVMQNLEGHGLRFEIGSEEAERLKTIVLEEESTLFMVLLALFNILLSRLSGREDIVVGSPVAGRVSAELEPIIGMFVNTLALRNYPAADKTFNGFLREVKAKCLSAFENQEYPFEELVEKLPVSRDTGRNPLFDVALDVQNANEPHIQALDIRIGGLKLKPYPYHSGISKFDLVFHCEEAEDKLAVTVDYAVKLFKEDTVKRLVQYFKKIVSHVVVRKDIQIGEMDLLSEKEKNEILDALNDTGVAFTPAKELHRVFEDRVNQEPHAAAVIDALHHLTYNELNRRANRLAHMLTKKRAGPDSIVGIMMESSTEMIIAILGVLKAGGAYLPIDPTYPPERITFMLADCSTDILLTGGGVIANHSFTALQCLESSEPANCHVTAPRAQLTNLDELHPVDRTVVDYEKYSRFIGQAMVKNAFSLQATRGCPYHCVYCHKIWPKQHISRSAENIFAEVQRYYDIGVRRFAFIDDIFNINIKNSRRFFELIIENGLDLQLFFPNGLRGDLLTGDYIDLMVKAGTVNMALALETASPRLQKLVGKNLDIEKLRENLEYLCRRHAHVILELFTMHGFPTETEAEALQTLDFVKSLKWLHFPYFHILKIYPNTGMAVLAEQSGIPAGTIAQSANLAFHQLPDTLPFDKQFTLKYQTDFLNRYFLLKERLLHVLPYQVKILTEDEIVQKYNSYLPVEIKTFRDLLEFTGIGEEELGSGVLAGEDSMKVPGLNKRLREVSGHTGTPAGSGLKILLLDLSQFFSKDSRNMLYDVVEPPLGLMYLLTALKRQFGDKVNGKAAKARMDFDSFKELKQLVTGFRPHLIGLRTLTYYKDFFHQTAALIRQWGIRAPIIAGGPYATSDYSSLLKDRNIDLVVLGEGELTLCDIAAKMLEKHGEFPGEGVLKQIPGIAFVQRNPATNSFAREIIMMDAWSSGQAGEEEKVENLPCRGRPVDTAYIIYTSGTTGKPKGVLVEHRNITGLMETGKNLFRYNDRDVWTMFHSYCFDFSVWEMYGALLYGGKLVLIPRMVARDPRRYLKILKKKNVTILNQTPTVFYQLIREEEPFVSKELRLRYVIFGGEALKPGKLKPWKDQYPGTRLINMYGITETTVHVTFKEITSREIDLNISNIGKPIPSLSGYIVNKHLRLQPVGVAGELCVGGQGAARGYLNRPELTKQKFFGGSRGAIFQKSPPGRRRQKVYKSGDLVRLLGNGEMEYLGRIDHQVKVRGNRVETGEIERRMMQLEGIEEVLVMAREDEKGEVYLCAYIKPVQGKAVIVPELRGALMKKLPGYMVPAYFIPLKEFPVTVTGKVDRRKLPFPEGLRPQLGAGYEAPQTGLARAIAGVWQEILKVDKVGIHDNFFDLGGSSLDIVRLAGRLKELLSTEIPIAVLFEYPTVQSFTRYLGKSQSPGAASAAEKSPDFSAKFRKGKAKMKGRRQRTRMSGGKDKRDV